MSNQKTVINPVMQRWLRAPGDLAPVVDCERCTMSLNDPENAKRWHSLKCCAFQPYVANFYCGAMLEAGLMPLPRDAGKAMLQPLGVLPVREFRALIEATPDHLRQEKHLCTFYDQASRRCGIWEYRPGECSLYYCGGDSKRREREQWSQKVFSLESDMAQMALAHLGFGPRAIAGIHFSRQFAQEPRLTEIQLSS